MAQAQPLPARKLALSGAQLDRVRSEQVRAVYGQGVLGVLIVWLAGFILAGMFMRVGTIDRTALIAWLCVHSLQSLARTGLWFAYRRARPSVADWRPWARAFTVGALVGGLTWGFGALIMMEPGRFDHQLMVVLVICAVVYGAMAAFGSYLPAFYAFLFPAFIPLIAWISLQGDIEHAAFGALSVLWLPVVAVMSFNHSRAIEESLRLRYENVELLEDLKRQKDLAEQANVAKSRFLASASHDLRQPVHALGMFVGALRAAEISEPAQRLLRHVEGSVSALDTLFTSLLDISRLDADVVRPAPKAFPIQPLLDRIARDHEVEAAEKGLAITVVATSLIVRSDPVLLERIVRNIVSNAVRYTERGRILIGCRRRGRGLDIEIWDTGAGISTEAREDIFQEFYQVGNPGRDRSQGLGLGLAIVRRLTTLLDHRLSLQSTLGKGSVFRIGVPLAGAGDVAPEEDEDDVAPGDLAHGLILVIDDETAIQEAMTSLLESWGHTVITAGSGKEILAKVADCTQRPDLIISDYRLRDENGIAVIEELQSEFNHPIPAMLLTGDTAPDRLVEARASGFVLLHKPLSEARLRAAMAAMAAKT